MTLDYRRPRQSQRTAARRRGSGLQIILDELESLTGLGPVKDEVYRIVDFARVVAVKKERNLPVSNLTFHMVFTGPPGTGKTTVARYIGKLLYELGLLRKDKLVEVDRSQLVGTHVGDTAVIVQDKVKEALDGVLFIDEAYTLAGGGGPTSSTDPYGQEALDTLIKLMEDNRSRLVCIFAGYTNEMRRFVDANPGLKSRISRHIEFPSYEEDELFAIWQSFVKRDGFFVTDEAEGIARKVVAEMARSADERSGNAREVRKFFEALQQIQAERISHDYEDFDQLSNQDLMTFTDEDVQYFIDAL